MIQIENLKKFDEKNMKKLVDLIRPELNKRAELYERYKRKANDSDVVSSKDSVVVPFEKYIVDIATGYLGGKEPDYEVEQIKPEKVNIVKKLLDKILNADEKYQDEMQTLIDYITRYNDDGAENRQLVKDILSTSACYEIIYENSDNEIVYSRLSPLQTVAVWDYSIPRNLIGIVNYHTEVDINNKTIEVVKLIDIDGSRTYKSVGGANYEKVEGGDEDDETNYWKDVPVIAVELQDGEALFEPVIELIKAYEELIKDTKETFSYNNDAKLKITGYVPDEPIMEENGNGELVENQKRIKHDEALLKAKIFYTPDDGDIEWIEKTVNDSAIQNTLKTYIDLIMMNTGVPQTTDLGFTKADNASAIDRKFFSLEQMTTEAMQLLKMAYKRRWELIFDRINTKNNTKYDFRDIKITMNKNLPANENEVVDMYMKLRGLISDETIINRIPLNLDATSELEKKDEQDEKELDKEVNKATAFSKVEGNEENITNE